MSTTPQSTTQPLVSRRTWLIVLAASIAGFAAETLNFDAHHWSVSASHGVAWFVGLGLMFTSIIMALDEPEP